MPRELTAIPLAEPCRAKQMLYGCLVPDPSDGRIRLWLTNMNETSGGELIAVDLESDTGEIYRWPAGHGSWHILPVADEKLVISTYYDGKFIVFDMKTKTFPLVVDFPGESYIWNMAQGCDGRVYGGTYSGAKLGAFDLETGTFEDCGTAVAGTGDQYLRHVKATPSGDIACTFGFAKKLFAVYKVREKKFVTLWEDDDVSPIAALRGNLFVSSEQRGLVALAGDEPWETEQPPLPGCPVEGGWTGVHGFSTDSRVFLRTKEAGLWRWSPDSDSLDLIFTARVRGGSLVGVTPDDRVVGIRGQDYFISTGKNDFELRRVPVESSGRPMHFLVGGSSGRIWGGPPFGQTVCYYEIESGDYHNTGAVVDAGGEVYGAVEVDRKLITASYSGGDFAIYDPEQPWNQWNGINPRPIGSVSEQGLIRPTGRMKRGPDGMLYSGWQAKYGTYGGALVRLDPSTDEITVWKDPLGPEPVVALAVDNRLAYVGTNLSANGLPTKPGDGQFGVIDLKTGGVVFAKRMDGRQSVSPIGAIRGPNGARLAVLPTRTAIDVFDSDSLEFQERIEESSVGTPESPWYGEDVLTTEDGALIFSRGPWLVKIGGDLSIEHFGPLPWNPNHVTLGADGMIYACNGPTLYRIDIS